MLIVFALAAMMATSSAVLGSAADKIWTLIGDENSNPFSSVASSDLPSKYRIYRFDEAAFRQSVINRNAPDGNVRLPVPTPDGILAKYVYWDSAVMEPALAANHPEIRTYQGYNVAHEAWTIRFDLSPTGFHGQGQASEGLYYISPLDNNHYIVFYAKKYRPYHTFNCENDDDTDQDQDQWDNLAAHPLINYGTIRKTFRIAVSATGEYTVAQGSAAAALSSIITAINFINEIYQREASVKMQVIANNSSIIYTNALLDPFTPELGNSSMLAQNQTSTDLAIGSANYDIGHVVHNVAGTSNSGSGVATLTATCRATVKARGVSTATRTGQIPINPFFYRILAHEIGHQFGAHHSFNSSCNSNRTDATAYEPGGGSTIMSYAGGCSPYNVQTLADTYFHRISLEEIATWIAGTGGTCAVNSSTGNAVPTAEAGASYTIPRSTPFVLTGLGSDANGNVLTYSWEQYNNEISTQPPLPTSISGPNFRSFLPATSPQRYFPRLADVLANISPTWEVLPSVSRSMNFSLVVRDGLGGASSDNTIVTIYAASGPFQVVSPNGGESRRATITVTWNPAGTNVAPINTGFVDILLSTNNGTTFTTLLADNTPNDGSQSVTLPAISTSQARIQVRAEGNIFYDVSNGPFTITP